MTTRRPEPPPVHLDGWDQWPRHRQMHQVLEWLSHDGRRADLYRLLQQRHDGLLAVASGASHADDDADEAGGAETTGRVWLVADPELIRRGLTDGTRFSNRPYRRLGQFSRSFMLGLDPQAGSASGKGEAGPADDASAHARQSQALMGALRGIPPATLDELARWGSSAAATLHLGQDRFDAVALAEDAALRVVQVLFGFEGRDFVPLRNALRAAYRAMTVQMLGCHFVPDSTAVVQGRGAMAALAARVGELLRDWALDQPGWPEDVSDGRDGAPTLLPLLARLARRGDAHADAHEHALVVVGALAGTVANIQAACGITLQHLLDDPARLQAARTAALVLGDAGDPLALLHAHIAPALRANPPAPFLPRRLLQDVGPMRAGDDVVLCLGAATADAHDLAQADALVFGLYQPGGGQPHGLHTCLGADLARRVLCRVVADVLRLPALEARLHPVDGRPLGLQKRWGFAVDTLPLQHRREDRVRQQPLNVRMPVKSPVAEHAPAIRAVLAAGAPRIEGLLRQARHVHFAWFQFHDHDSVLVLHTVFDGNFEAYLHHFALEAGPLFDALFEHLDVALPRPVKDHPEAFVQVVLAHHHRAVAGYFYSAYPQGDTPAVQRALAALPPSGGPQ